VCVTSFGELAGKKLVTSLKEEESVKQFDVSSKTYFWYDTISAGAVAPVDIF
jgi:hypothetical protein